MTEIINLSGMYEKYDPELFKGCRFIDLKDTPGTKLYIDAEGEKTIRDSISHDGSHLLHLIDIGDYHYITRLYLYDIGEPFDLLVFDHHNDDQKPEFEGMRSCGSWIRDAMEDMPETLKSVKLIKAEMEQHFIKGRFSGERPLYISVDKDVLSREVCPTNWDQGEMGLDTLMDLIRSEAEGRRLIGLDICGGPSPTDPDPKSILKNQTVDREICSKF